ncbi:formimidoylglutamase [Kocuria palustris]|uniref:formimidoylglutamase n=1 Tax=Kocuria palustris TaxID=71999 RepID=UPI00119D3169|nr:formimidoylglutamase [Kocuria palustris]
MNSLPTWSGRSDGPGDEHRRLWSSIIGPASPDEAARSATAADADAALLGFRSDEGVSRNAGRVGAAEGPDALRAALGALALQQPLSLYDAGDVMTQGEDLEGGQAEVGRQLAALRRDCGLTGLLGGGHESAWASYLGLAEEFRGRRLGILNLDAHFDLRQADRPTSGTPFRQIAEHRAAAGDPFDYRVIGISEPGNTRALFDTARDLGVGWLTDVGSQQVEPVVAQVQEFAAQVDGLYLTIDLDVLPACVAPGVSAPAGLGVPAHVILAACSAAAGSGRLRHFDVVELNPSYDVDSRTARTAARLIHEILSAATAAAAPQ